MTAVYACENSVPQVRREGEEERNSQMKSWNLPKPRNWEQSKVSIWICEELSVVDVGLPDQGFFRLPMRRKRSQALFPSCAPGDVLSTTTVSLNTSENQESLRHFEQYKVRWLPHVVLGVTTQEQIFLSTLRQKNKEEETENERLGVQPKTKRCAKKLSFELFMSSMCNTFTGIFSGYMVYWLTNKHRSAI